MSPIISNVAIILTVYIVVVLIIKKFKLSFIDVSGFQFVLIGILFSAFFRQESDGILIQLKPMIWFCISLIGFRYGLNFRFTDFGKNNPLGYKIALFDAVWTFLSLFGGLTLVMMTIFNREPFDEKTLLFTLPLSIIGIVSSLSAANHIHKNNKSYGQITDFSIYTIKFQQIVALFLFGVIFLIFHEPNEEINIVFNSSGWTFVSLFLPIFLGFLYQIALRSLTNERNLKILLFSFVAINTGVAVIFKFSPILFGLTVGIVIANTSRYTEKLMDEIKLVNRTVSSIILIYSGAIIVLETHLSSLIILAVFLLFRLLGKSLGQSIGNAFITQNDTKYHNLSWLFMSQGRIATVMALSLYEFFPSDWSMVILTVTVASTLINEFYGLRTYRNLLIEEEEIISEDSLL